MLVVGGMLFVFCILMYLYFNVFVSPRDEDVSLVIQGLGGKANQEKEPIQKHTNTNTNTKNRDKGGGIRISGEGTNLWCCRYLPHSNETKQIF